MPLRDHFHPPLTKIASWEELHGQWPAVIVQQLRKQLGDSRKINLPSSNWLWSTFLAEYPRTTSPTLEAGRAVFPALSFLQMSELLPCCSSC